MLQSPTPQPQQPSGAEQQPPNPPRVSLMGGLLTVAAENSTLADILKAIETVTHASLEGTQPDAERVFGQFGPGAPRQVLSSILSGSHYDFILVGAVDDPGSVERIMLSPHGTAPVVRGNSSSNNSSKHPELFRGRPLLQVLSSCRKKKKPRGGGLIFGEVTSFVRNF
ncbi:MAG: hypothetical protein DMG63_16400 [Acidobacteria bacterium]|nr:MAG: hypothetical protein DMG63_16400 [Acidobacteriota bacterium]